MNQVIHTHIGVCINKTRIASGLEIRNYFFYLGTKDRLRKMDGIVSVKKIPEKFNSLREGNPWAPKGFGIHEQTESIGNIQYRIIVNQEGVINAESYIYYPKRFRPNVKRLGYFLEAIAVNHLRKDFPDILVSTSKTPSQDRIKQLEKVGLKPFVEYETSKWLKSLGKGIKDKGIKEKE